MNYCRKTFRYQKAMQRRLFAIIFAMLALIYLTSDTYAQNIRGRLMKGPDPIAGIAVRVLSPNLGPSGITYSGHDGMYYLYNIQPGPYTLQVFDIPHSPLSFQIFVHPQQWVDIAPIQIRSP